MTIDYAIVRLAKVHALGAVDEELKQTLGHAYEPMFSSLIFEILCSQQIIKTNASHYLHVLFFLLACANLGMGMAKRATTKYWSLGCSLAYQPGTRS